MYGRFWKIDIAFFSFVSVDLNNFGLGKFGIFFWKVNVRKTITVPIKKWLFYRTSSSRFARVSNVHLYYGNKITFPCSRIRKMHKNAICNIKFSKQPLIDKHCLSIWIIFIYSSTRLYNVFVTIFAVCISVRSLFMKIQYWKFQMYFC